MILMNPKNNNLTNLDLNPGQPVRSVPGWGGLLCGIRIPLGVTLYSDESCDGGVGSLDA